MTRNFLVFLFALFILLLFSFAFGYVSIYSEVLIAGIFALVGLLTALIVAIMVGLSSPRRGRRPVHLVLQHRRCYRCRARVVPDTRGNASQGLVTGQISRKSPRMTGGFFMPAVLPRTVTRRVPAGYFPAGCACFFARPRVFTRATPPMARTPPGEVVPGRRLPEPGPTDEERDHRHDEEDAGGTRCGQAGQHHRPRDVGQRRRPDAEVDHGKGVRDRRVADLACQTAAEREQEQGPGPDRPRGDLQGTVPVQHGLLDDVVRAGRDGGEENETGPPAQGDARALAQRDHQGPEKADADPDPSPGPEALAEEDDGSQRGPDGQGLDEEGRGARGDALLTDVQGDVVEGEPQEPEESDERNVLHRRAAHPRPHDDDRAGHGGGQEAQEREVRRRVGMQPRADAGERGTPEHDRDQSGGGAGQGTGGLRAHGPGYTRSAYCASAARSRSAGAIDTCSPRAPPFT